MRRGRAELRGVQAARASGIERFKDPTRQE
jgi:hypothetical protein